MLQAAEAWPVNFAFLGKGNAATVEPLAEQIRAGAAGLKLHEDWGTTPAAIDACLRAADRFDVQVAIHTDTINESGFVEDTIAAIAGRTIHTYHTEGAGGGHAPDIIKIAGFPNVLPSSTNPTRPYTVNTLSEHLDMLMVCHHLNPQVPEDVAFAESRILQCRWSLFMFAAREEPRVDTPVGYAGQIGHGRARWCAFPRCAVSSDGDGPIEGV